MTFNYIDMMRKYIPHSTELWTHYILLYYEGYDWPKNDYGCSKFNRLWENANLIKDINSEPWDFIGMLILHKMQVHLSVVQELHNSYCTS